MEQLKQSNDNYRSELIDLKKRMTNLIEENGSLKLQVNR